MNFYFETENETGLQERKRIEVEVQDPNNDDDCEEGDDCTDDLYYYFIFGEYIFLSHLHEVYGCETWSPTLREEHRLRVFENRVLRRIFGPKKDEVTREWRKLHNEELRDLYSSPSI
jgi:hypothetical protein